jgi:hypothetical protein
LLIGENSCAKTKKSYSFHHVASIQMPSSIESCGFIDSLDRPENIRGPGTKFKFGALTFPKMLASGEGWGE